MEHAFTAIVALVSGGALLKLSEFVFDVIKRRQQLKQDDQGFLTQQYREFVEKLQGQLIQLREQADRLDQAYQIEVKDLLKANADMRVENATLVAENRFLKTGSPLGAPGATPLTPRPTPPTQ